MLKSPFCAVYIIEHAGQTALATIMDWYRTDKVSEHQGFFRKMTHDLLAAINIMHRDKYIHNDMHLANVAFSGTVTNPAFRLIDYGETRRVHPDSSDAIINFDLLSGLLPMLAGGDYWFIDYASHYAKWPDQDRLIQACRKTKAWPKIKKYGLSIFQPGTSAIVRAVFGETDLAVFDNAELGQTTQVLDTLWFIVDPNGNHAFWKKHLPKIPKVQTMIPQQDLLFILDNYHDMKKLLKHFK